jgi:multidrug efflux pump
MQRLQRLAAEAIAKDPDVSGVVSVVGVSTVNPTPNAGRFTITLKPRNGRWTGVVDIIARLKAAVAPIPGLTLYFQPVQDIQIGTRASRAQYQYTLTGTDADEVRDWSAKLAERLRSEPVLREVASEAQEGGLRALLDVDREIAGRLGISMQVVSDTLYDAFGQRQISTIYGQANQYRVILEAMPQYQTDPSSLAKLYVPASGIGQVASALNSQNSLTGIQQTSTTIITQGGSNPTTQVPISAFATLKRTVAPLAIMHEAQFPATTISFDLAPGAALSEAVSAISAAQHEIGMPPAVTGSYSGDAAEFAKSLAGEPWLILAAVVTIYIILGVLYESFIHPFTILTTLPSAGVGALLALMLCGQDLSIVALIGIVLLMGIVKKNAIMMIDFALEAERVEGLSPRDSIVQASMLRFRPIMMTTLAALFGALPLALEGGTVSELRFPLGVTIIGGLLLSQLLTLYTTPVIYLSMERLRARLARAAWLVPEADTRRRPRARPAE